MQPETLNRSIQPTPTVHPRGFTPTCVQYWKAANSCIVLASASARAWSCGSAVDGLRSMALLAMEGRTLQGRARHEAKPPALVALLPSGSDLIRDSLLQHQRNPSRRSATALAFRIPVWRRVVGQPRPLVSSRARSPRPGAGPSSRPKLASSRAARAGTPAHGRVGCLLGQWKSAAINRIRLVDDPLSSASRTKAIPRAPGAIVPPRSSTR